MTPKRGPIIEVESNVQVGVHIGLWTYTIGESSHLPGLTNKLFVASKDPQENAIYVALAESV